ncbi:MAG: carboxypeptidase-like regulatory domain-containing protein, partial [Acidobacteria bacterium]|nr:carboxypeptidase-like regulatory domain-containing protein [Acidobacteriota bacterium]
MLPLNPSSAQTETTGAIEGQVVNGVTNDPIPGILVTLVNRETEVSYPVRTNSEGRFIKQQLLPGSYFINVNTPGFEPKQQTELISITRSRMTRPSPIRLTPSVVQNISPTPTPDPSGTQPPPTPTPTAIATPPPPDDPEGEPGSEGGVDINTTDGRRDGSYPEKEVKTLPLGAATLTRTFDELALLLPGVAPPPQPLGDVAGPGVGPGVGSAGQFAVNGLRSRGNNFTVDGSDNNDEDIGVRRQGFLALVPQPIESVQEYQVISLLAPAQFGRNFGAQVNAVSRSGGNETHGTAYGFFNSSQLNARNFFDTVGGSASMPLQGRQLNADGTLSNRLVNVFVDARQRFVTNNAREEDSLTLGQAGFVLGGPLVPERPSRPGRSLFYFISAEGQLLNATQEANFAVPTVEQRGLFNSGATGLSRDPFFGNPVVAFPTTVQADAIFSLFPFPNNPNGVYGRNTFTQVLPAGGQGKVLSGKADGNFRLGGRQQQLSARYNFTDDWRDIPVTGDAIFSTLRSRVRTQNFSAILNSELSGPDSARPIFNQLRASYGRTRLIFDERRDTEFLSQSNFARTLRNPKEGRFLLDAPVLFNNTRPGSSTVQYDTNVRSIRCPNGQTFTLGTVEDVLNNLTNVDPCGIAFGFPGFTGYAPVGQVIIGGFSPVGVDVFNFPQRRVNNTYQL